MAYAVHTAMNRVKGASLDPPIDLPPCQPQAPKLIAGNDAVLATRYPCHPTVVTLTTYTGVNVTRVGHPGHHGAPRVTCG